MIPSPVLLLLVKATIVLLLALGMTRAMHRAPAGARHLVWLVSLGALLLVPALTAWAPVRLAVLPAVSELTASGFQLPAGEAPSRAEPELPFQAGGPTLEARSSSPAVLPARDPQPTGGSATNPLALVFAIWAVIALAIGASIAHAWFAVQRIVRHSSPLASRDWLDPLYEVADRLGLEDAPRIVRSDDAKMPFACGIRQPTIVLPADCDQWSAGRRRAVLLHELAHVRRRDLAGHTLGRLVCAVYWFHPLVWTAAKRLRSESERACDDLALVCGARAADYAEHLLEIVTSARRDRTPSVALAMARPSEFEGRMLAILDPELPRRAASRARTASLIGGLAAMSLAVGAAAPVQRSTPPSPAGLGTPVASYDADSGVAALDTFVDWRRGAKATAKGKAAADPRTEARIDAQAEANARARHGEPVETAIERAVQPLVSSVLQGVTRGLAGGAEGTILQGRSASERAELLARVLRSDTSASLRRVAAWGLSEYVNEAVASEALAHALRRDANVRVREMAAWSLGTGESRHQAALDALTAALRGDAETEVRATAAWSLGNIERSSTVEALAAALADRDVGVRLRAAWAIGNIEPAQAPRQLVALLSDRDPKLREVAAWALYNIEDAAAVPALQAALRAEQDKELQIAYIRALASLGDGSVGALRTLLESSDQRVRSMAVKALAGGDAAGPWPWPWPEPRPYP
ncbi:MAG TPA: HEAT repeat domain-containing protein [Gemmatimonadaceae bacterium]|nr:HEAT repeat domain-containing protein [Gemmatimonadaceae bacterium]